MRRPRTAAAAAFAVILAAAIADAAEHGDKHAEGDHYAAHQRDYVFGSPADPTEAWTLAQGGRLYDNWWEALGTDAPAATHPAYPAAAKQTGPATWRCKECHGWDYKGRDGAYATGSHATGIAGLGHLQGANPATVMAALRAPLHGYTAALIPDDAAQRLARFVVAGQHDTAAMIDQAGAPKTGDAGRGQPVYQNVCAACHGFDGRALNFGSAAEPEYIGTVARENPWEALHKIRNGQPGAPMPAMRAFDLGVAADVLAYARTLPAR